MEAVRDRSLQALLETHDWDIHRLPTNTAYLDLRSLPIFFRSLAGLVALRFQRLDAVWLNYVNFPDLAFLAFARLLGFRVVVTPHLGKTARSQADSRLRRLSCWILGFANRIALLAKSQEQEVNLPANVPISYIKTFLPASIIKGHMEERQAPPVLRLLHASKLSHAKGTFAFVELCHRLKKGGIPFAASMAGGASEEIFMQVRTAIAECDLNDHVKVLGHKSDAEMQRLYRSSDVLVHLSQSDSYPLVVLESMACGVLPVCIGLAGARDMITTYDGHLVGKDHAVEEAAAFLSHTSLDEIRRRAADIAGRVRADHDWNKCAGLLVEALRAGLGGIVREEPSRSLVAAADLSENPSV
jgi:glycosyltransferase involved in cell wall biosynthesis